MTDYELCRFVFLITRPYNVHRKRKQQRLRALNYNLASCRKNHLPVIVTLLICIYSCIRTGVTIIKYAISTLKEETDW